MAASIVNGCRRILHNSTRICLKDRLSRHYASSTGAYFVFLPEVPLDTKETNPIMRTDQFPQYSQLHINNIITGCAKLSFEFDLKYEDLLEMLADETKKLELDEFFVPLEEVLMPLHFAERTVNILYCTNPIDYKRGLLNRIQVQVDRARSQRFLNGTIYNSCMNWAQQEENLTEPQQRILNHYLTEARMNGADLTGNKRKKVRGRFDMIVDKEKEFLDKSIPHSANFQRTLTSDDYEIVKELPKHIRLLMAQDSAEPDRGPWIVSMGNKIFEPFMEYCPRRGLRSAVWVDKHLVGSHKTGDVRTHTFQLIDDIRMHKNDIAKTIGFSCFAEMVNDNKMADSIEAVQDMFKTYRRHFLPMARKEIEDLKDFIADRGLDIDLQQWDIPYFKRLQAEQLYKVNRIDKRQYFSLNNVTKTLFKLAEKLFQIKIQHPKIEPLNIWHKDVRVFHVYNLDGKLIGTVYMDLFARVSGKMWVSSEVVGRDRSQHLGTTPISYVTMELTKSNTPEIPHTVSFKEVLEIFFQFGYSLRNILADSPYAELNNNLVMEYDVVHTLPYLMKQFAKVPWVVRDMSDHVLSGEKLSNKVIDNLIKCQDHMIGYQMCHEIFYSAFDQEVHGDNETYWKDIQQEQYKKYMPIPLNFEDWGFCSDPTLWVGRQYCAAYYSFIWSQMLAANVFESFKEAGLEDEAALASVGKRLRSTVLEPAAGVEPLTVFRRFKGCNPSLEALTRLYPAYEDCEPLSDTEDDIDE